MIEPNETVTGLPWLTGHVVDENGVHSADADGAIARAGKIVDAIESLVNRRAAAPSEDELIAGTPIIHRGEAEIVPLSWEPAQPEDVAAALRERANEVWKGIRSACEYHHGAALSVALDRTAPANAYREHLVRHGVRRADWWGADGVALVLVVHGAPLPARASASALHIVPVGWVSDVRPTRRIPDVDLSWSPATNVESARVRHPSVRDLPAGSTRRPDASGPT
ncbi:hypothetical protein [Microbacterium sp. MM2322]|jgi:hypothetical protein|uniref:hypothetical protein n=1 Tax=Microbacterium sp. MM2322 TaxID=3157631 RepID=UPI0032D594A3